MIVATSTPSKWGIGSALIKWYQGGTSFSHILIIKDDLVFQASHGYVNCQYVEVFKESNTIINTFSIDDSKVNFDFVKQNLGRQYGYDQILEIAFKFLTNIKIKSNGNKRFICSEFVGKALMLDWVNDYTTPAEVEIYLLEQTKKFA